MSTVSDSSHQHPSIHERRTARGGARGGFGLASERAAEILAATASAEPLSGALDAGAYRRSASGSRSASTARA